MTGGARSLRLDDVRAMLRLCNQLHAAPPDPVRRKKHLLDALCRLVPAASATSAVYYYPGPRADATPLSVVHGGPGADPPGGDGEAGDGRPDAAADPLSPSRRPGTPGTRRSRRDALEHCVRSDLPLATPGARLVACLTLRRPAGRGRAFSPRDRRVVRLLHSELGWLYQTDLMLASPQVAALTPRQKETLQLLLAGHGEKQIAARLGLSRNTVHHYVKAIHRHFGVSSRSELLAKWLQKRIGE